MIDNELNIQDLARKCKKLLDSELLSAWERAFLMTIQDKCREDFYVFTEPELKKVQSVERSALARQKLGVEHEENTTEEKPGGKT